MEMKDWKSEFGKGLCYCLGLFIAHAELHKNWEARLWFNAASDHLAELQVDYAPENIKDRLKAFQEIIMEWGHGFNHSTDPTDKDVEWAIQQAKDYLREIDEAHGVPVEKGQWE